MAESVSREFVTVFEGSAAEVQVLRVVLEARGFFTYLAHEIVKSIDPFITGVGMFSLALQVPQDKAAEAISVISDIRGSRPEAVEQSVPDDPEVFLERLGRSVRWGAIVCLFLGPVPILAWVVLLVFAVFYTKYVVSAVRLGVKPRAHALTLFAAVVVIVSFLPSLLFPTGWI